MTCGKHLGYRVSLLPAALVAALYTASASGQATSASAQDTTVRLEPIVVTATRRAESAQDVPLSLQTFTGEQLSHLGADSFSGYADVTPGLQLIDAGPSNTQIVMRGVTTGAVQQSQQALRETVGLYLDDTSIAVQRFNPNLNLFDFERIEVLRGPQGTLFGAGAMSGLIRMIANKPDTHDYHSSVQADYLTIDGGGNGWTADGMLNLPLANEKAALRLVGSTRQIDGYIDNTFLGKSDINNEDTNTGRIALRMTPTERTTIDLSVLYKEAAYESRFAMILEAGDLKTYTTILEPEDTELTVSSLTGAFDLGNFTLTLVSSYMDNQRTWLSEAGGFTDFLTGGDDISAAIDNLSAQREFSQEVRLSSNATEGIRYVVGLYYQSQDHEFAQDVTVPGIDALSGLPSTDFGAQVDQLYFGDVQFDTSQFAAFGELVWPITNKLDLTTGLRWSKWDQDTVSEFGGILSFPNIGQFEFKNDESKTTPRINLAYQLADNKILYAEVSEGFRLGGTNDPLPSPICDADLANVGLSNAPQSFDSDSLWNYELGTKTAWAAGRVQFNIALYKIAWKDVQFATLFNCGFNIYINAGDLDIHGLETDVSALLGQGFTLNAAVSYTKSELAEDNTVLGAQKGAEAPYTPEFKGSVSLEYERRVVDQLLGFVHLDLSYVDERVSGFDPDSSAFLVFPSYTLANARVGIASDRWQASVYVFNLTDERAYLSGEFYPFSETPGTRKFVARPRTYGLQVGFKF